MMLKHPGHLTSMKKEFGLWTSLFSLWVLASIAADGWRRSTGIFVVVLKEVVVGDG